MKGNNPSPGAKPKAKRMLKAVSKKAGEVLLGAVLTLAAIPPIGVLLIGIIF